MQGFTQYLIWSKIVAQSQRASGIVDLTDDSRLATSVAVRDSLNASVQAFFNDYPAKILSTRGTVNDALNNITNIPDSFWPLIQNGSYALNFDNASPDLQDAWLTLGGVAITLVTSMINALYAAFGINLDNNIVHKDPATAKNVIDGEYQFVVRAKTWDRYRLVVCKEQPASCARSLPALFSG